MKFSYLDSIALSDVPVLSAEGLADAVVARVDAGQRVLALFGLPEARGVGLFCLLADESHRLTAMRTTPLNAFDSMTPRCPQVHLFERELFEQWNIRPEGHPAQARALLSAAERRDGDPARPRANPVLPNFGQ